MTKIKLVQIGLGGHGEYVGTHYVLRSEEFVYAGVADVNPARLALCGERLSCRKSAGSAISVVPWSNWKLTPY